MYENWGINVSYKVTIPSLFHCVKSNNFAKVHSYTNSAVGFCFFITMHPSHLKCWRIPSHSIECYSRVSGLVGIIVIMIPCFWRKSNSRKFCLNRIRCDDGGVSENFVRMFGKCTTENRCRQLNLNNFVCYLYA